MKQFVHAILSAAALAALAGCASSQEEKLFAIDDPVRDAVEQDIAFRMEMYKAGIAENKTCVYSSPLAKTLFADIPAVAQQKKFMTLAYDMESLDGAMKVSYMFAPGRRMKFVVRDNSGAVRYAQILNGDNAFSSTDGIEYSPITLPEHINELRLNYDMTMAFAQKANKVSLVDYEIKAGKDSIREPQEHNVDDQRCWKFDVEFGDKDYSALITVFISADEKKHQISNVVTPVAGLAKNPITVKCSRFVEGDFVFPGFITTDSKDAPQLTLKKYVVNQSISDLEFEPDMVK